MRRNFLIGIIRVITLSSEQCNCHGRLLESMFPMFSTISRCIPDQPEGVHDEETETIAIPKIRILAKEFECLGVDGIVISCCGDPGIQELRKELDIPVVGAGESTALLSRRYGEKIFSLGITENVPENYKKILGEKFIDNSVPEGIKSTLDLQSDQGWKAICREAEKFRIKGADAIALACTGMSTIGIAPKLEKITGIPVLDPVMCEGIIMYMELLRRGKKE